MPNEIFSAIDSLNHEVPGTRGVSPPPVHQQDVVKELHDVIGHRLTLISLLARKLTQAADHAAAAHQIDDLARIAAKELREIVRGIGDTAHGANGVRSIYADIAAALVHVPADRIDLQTGSLTPPYELSDDFHRLIVRTLQETTTNALRRGNGPVRITVECTDRLCITVTNATPSHPLNDSPDQMGTGLCGLSQRVSRHGGWIQVGVSRDGTHCLRVLIPLTSAESGRDRSTCGVQR